MLRKNEFAGAITLFQEAAVLPELWPDALDKLAKAAGSAGAALVCPSVRLLRSESLAECAGSCVAEGWTHADTPGPRHLRLAERATIPIWTDRDLYTPEEYARDPFQQSFARRFMYGGTATCVVARTMDGPVFVSVTRSITDEQFSDPEVSELATNLLPGLRAAGILATHLGFARTATTADAFEAAGTAAVLVGDRGRIVRWTSSAEPILKKLGTKTILACCGSNPDVHVHRSCETGGRIVVRPVAIVGVANDLFSPARTILFLTDLDDRSADAREHPSMVALLGQAFPELTKAEAKFAAHLATGMSLDDTAAITKLTRETARFRLKRVFRKTGTHRQGELVALLSRLSPRSG